ncbi:hypothetical protein TUM4442_31010 [Shewanella algae]|nr:hypothetical protein TUM4442_31010 [Shewanella algae]
MRVYTPPRTKTRMRTIQLLSAHANMSLEMDNETWLIEFGDDIIDKKAERGIEALSNYEKAVYCLWVIDYSIRNSGTLDAVEDLYPEAPVEFESLVLKHNWLSKFRLKETF